MKQHSTSTKKLSIVNYPLSIVNYSIILLLFFAFPVKSQVTIGSLDPPHSFSVLELITKNHDGGLRLPLLSTDERDNLKIKDLVGDDAEAAEGLVIYNTTINCLEFWNGETWISMCSDVLPCSSTVFPVLGTSYTLCTNATFSDLTASVGGKELWYDAATGGAAHADTDPLISGTTYYAEEFVGSCINQTRYPVTVTLGDCTAAPTNGNVTTFTNVMYDFQHQTLEAYGDDGIPTGYRWQVSEDNSAFNDIAGVPNSNFYTVPPHFADSYANAGTTGLYFRCILSNTIGNTTTSSINILFINTSSAGYGKDIIGSDTVRYLTIQTTNKNFPSGTMKIALTNLGASENNDAGDLGDFYQWGRVKDGHEHIVWSKDPSTRVNIFGDGTSAPIPGPATAVNLDDATGQIKDDGNDYYGNFIISSSRCWETANPKLWGNGVIATARATSDIPLSSPPPPPTPPPTTPTTLLWGYATNNPCPDNWSVPSIWNIWDICGGNGASSPSSVPLADGVFKGVNTWQWRRYTNNAIGGNIITNANGEKVFLPAPGTRDGQDALLYEVGTGTYLTCSLVYSTNAYNLRSNAAVINACTNGGTRTTGYSVRCVSE